MTSAVCPYCRGPIEPEAGDQLVCQGCGTPHHADCYAENGGCTVFGCSAAPAEEPKLRLSGAEIVSPAPATPLPASTTLGLPTAMPSASPIRVKTPPPPPPPGSALPAVPSVPRFGAGSVLFGAQPVAAVAAAPASTNLLFEDDPNAKNRITFIILGVLLGPVGAHNFYAGYRKKAIAQLCITLFTLGLASPMSWIWAVIDIWTVDRDSQGVKFKS